MTSANEPPSSSCRQLGIPRLAVTSLTNPRSSSFVTALRAPPLKLQSPGRLEAAGQKARLAGSGPTGREESTASFAAESHSFLSPCGIFFARVLTNFRGFAMKDFSAPGHRRNSFYISKACTNNN
jgi:hypothetical protein